MFLSRTKRCDTIGANTGTEKDKTYKMEITETGRKHLKEDGHTNRYEKIQEYAENCILENLIKRYQLGDTKALFQRQAVFLDTTELPSNLAEAQRAMQQMENIFNSLPKDIRKLYNNSKEEFIADYGSEKFKNIFTPKAPIPEFKNEPPMENDSQK